MDKWRTKIILKTVYYIWPLRLLNIPIGKLFKTSIQEFEELLKCRVVSFFEGIQAFIDILCVLQIIFTVVYFIVSYVDLNIFDLQPVWSGAHSQLDTMIAWPHQSGLLTSWLLSLHCPFNWVHVALHQIQRFQSIFDDY